jgi:hypothetical protein
MHIPRGRGRPNIGASLLVQAQEIAGLAITKKRKCQNITPGVFWGHRSSSVGYREVGSFSEIPWTL